MQIFIERWNCWKPLILLNWNFTFEVLFENSVFYRKIEKGGMPVIAKEVDYIYTKGVIKYMINKIRWYHGKS